VVRTPGSPGEQEVTLLDAKLHLIGDTTLVVAYTPADDPPNGNLNGDSPAWVTLTWEDGTATTLGHNFNVRQLGTWTWTVSPPELAALMAGKPLTFEVTASDVGSDDLHFRIDFGDGAWFTATAYNDGVGPDPYPSPDVNPIAATVIEKHDYGSLGTYGVVVTVADDDGGTTSAMWTLRL